MYIFLCQGENKINIFKLDINDQNMTYVFASKVTHVTYLNLNLQKFKVFQLKKILKVLVQNRSFFGWSGSILVSLTLDKD